MSTALSLLVLVWGCRGFAAPPASIESGPALLQPARAESIPWYHPSSPQRVGGEIEFSVPDSLRPEGGDVRLNVRSRDGQSVVFHDFQPFSPLPWVPVDPGEYEAEFTLRSADRETATTHVEGITILPPLRLPSVAPTRHPLIFLFSSGPMQEGSGRLEDERAGAVSTCEEGCVVRALFRAEDAEDYTATHSRPFQPEGGTGFLLAGLRTGTRYRVRQEILNESGARLALGSELGFETGPVSVDLPAVEIITPPQDEVSTGLKVILGSGSGRYNATPQAWDTEGHLLWFLEGAPGTLMRPLGRGRFVVFPAGRRRSAHVLRVVDLAGNLVGSTSLARLNEQLAELGADSVRNLHHEARPLPGGGLAVLGKVIRDGDSPSYGPSTTLVADQVVVLDRDFQVTWVWSSLEHLDTARPPALESTCAGPPGCPVLPPGVVAVDWTHANAVDYSSSDGNLIVTVRHQDWVVKVDYADGSGEGGVIWRLGREGDFGLWLGEGLSAAAEIQPSSEETPRSSRNAHPPADEIPPSSQEVFPWFSYPHDGSWASGERFVVFDNGNTRCIRTQDCMSRGQVYRIDEEGGAVQRLLSVPLGTYAFALGSAQGLPEGHSAFGLGIFPCGVNVLCSEVRDLDSEGRLTFALRVEETNQRFFRLRDLYSLPEY